MLVASLNSVSCLALLIVQLASTAKAFQFITEATLPSDSLSAGCVAALTSDVNCARQVGSFLPGTYRSAEVLEETCTSECSTALAQYQAAAEASCTESDVFPIAETRDAPASFLPQVLFYNFNRTCINDDGRWCNSYAKEIAESNATVSVSGSSTNGAAAQVRQAAADPCDDCILKQLQFQAGSPINNGFQLQSRYSSLTSSCLKTNFPLSSSTTPFPVDPLPTQPSSECSGSSYAIQAGDTCRSISVSQGIGTAWLLYDNGLAAFCADFPASGTLCLQNTCTVYTVQANDTCDSIIKANRLSQVQLITWNPILGDSCNSFNNSIGDAICVTPPGDPSSFTNPTFTTTTASPSTTAVPVPTNIASGTTTNCAQYHLVEKGEYCNLLVVKFSITLEDFLFLNQGVNSNCTNLFAEESYCVEPVGAIDQYPSHSNYVPTTTTFSTVPYDSLPKATFTPPAITGLPVVLPLANGTRSDCYLYANADDLELTFDIGTTFFTSVCEAIAQGWSITLSELENWNPSLQTNSTECAPLSGYRYCMAAWNDASYTRTTTLAKPTASALPIRDGATSECKDYASVVQGMTCQNVLDWAEITIDQFYEWNPSIGSQCENLWIGYRYCIRVDDVPVDPEEPTTTTATTSSSTSTSTSTAPEPSPTAPAPVQDGIAENCNAWHVAGDGLYCYDITVKYGITMDQFLEWNPAVSDDCSSGFWGGYAYCVGVSS